MKKTFIILSAFASISVSAQTTMSEADTIPTYKSLKLKGVEVTAQRRASEGATSYIMGRNVLDHAQLINLSDIMSLMPGGKTINSTLTDDSRLSLHSGSGEKGNAAFGTAIEVDGIRLDNNSMIGEVLSPSTRNISSSNIGSIEVITGVAGVEYGDISNGIVKINPRRGRTPWIFEGSVNPYTRQFAINKGFSLSGRNGDNGTAAAHSSLNLSLEHAQSFRNSASPYEKYMRNTMTVGYDNTLRRERNSGARESYSIHASLTGNFGGYNNEADPDAFKDTYTKVRDNQLRGVLDLSWIYNKQSLGLWKVSLHGAFATSDKRSEENVNKSSASAQPLIHTLTTGYALSQDYNTALTTGGAIGNIITGPTGYWYERCFNDQKPLTGNQKIKGEWTKVFRENNDKSFAITNKVMLGVEHSSSRNNGNGMYYEDLSSAPTWRPYVYADLPTLHNTALFLEDKLTMGKIQFVAGLRDDITSIAHSEYGTVSSLSPRFTVRYRHMNQQSKSGRHALEGTIHAGWGKSVKLPSFQVLYPADSYTDIQVFASGSTADNKSYYAYYTNVQKSAHNASLKWQYSNQFDIGFDAFYRGFKFSMSGFYTKTRNPYQMVSIYSPLSINKTGQSAIPTSGVTVADRQYTIDRQTGNVSLNGTALPSSTYHLFSTGSQYVNGAPVTRYGIEWILDIPVVSNRHLVGMTLRLDGSYYHYKGVDNTLFAAAPNGSAAEVAEGSAVSSLIGYYNGSSITSASTLSTASVSNGSLSKGLNMNATLTARIPKVGLIMTLKVESTFLNYRKQLAEGNNAIVLKAAGDIFGEQYEGQQDMYVASYPTYYSTWENPTERIPFAEALQNAYNSGNQTLYNQLTKLIVRSNTSYYFNPESLSSYFSCNFSVTKEIGRYLSVSLYANNFLNNMAFVKSSQTNLESSLFNSGYIPKFYYGMSLRVKL